MRRSPSKRPRPKKTKSKKKPAGKKKITPPLKTKTKNKKIGSKPRPKSGQKPFFFSQGKEAVESTKFTATEEAVVHEPFYQPASYTLPVRYGDNRIMLLVRDPWWLHTYWDISEAKVSEIISSIPLQEREHLAWIVRVYDVTGVRDFRGDNANSFFDCAVHFEANNWYINVNKPDTEWCVEVGLISPSGRFFPVARSNFIKTPCFGISSVTDEEWMLPDDEYFRLLGIYDLGKSSLERRRKFEEIFKKQISSPLASWGVSSIFSEKAKPQEKFFLEVGTELILYGRTEPGATVYIEGKQIAVRPDGTFSVRYALPTGEFTFGVSATSSNKKHKRKVTPAVKRYNKK